MLIGRFIKVGSFLHILELVYFFLLGGMVPLLSALARNIDDSQILTESSMFKWLAVELRLTPSAEPH